MGLPKSEATELVSAREYLAIERQAFERSEWYDGRMVAMSGESDPHGDITANLSATIGTQLRKTPCRHRIKDTKVRSGPLGAAGQYRGLFSYPDIVIICGEPKYLDEHTDVVTNPKVIIEVLSPSTEKFDREEKFLRYDRWNDTLSDYILVAQDAARVQHFQRQKDGSWKYRIHVGRTASVVLADIGVTLRLARIYERVTFPKPPLPPRRKRAGGRNGG